MGNPFFIGIMPCYREIKTVEVLAQEVAKCLDLLIVVIDGGSTGKGIDTYSRIVTLTHAKRNGISVSINTAMRFISRKFPYLTNSNTWVVIFDGDGQHPLHVIKSAVNLVRRLEIPCLCGRRNLTAYPLYKKIGNFGLTVLARLLTFASLHDVECGFKVVRFDLLRKVLSHIRFGHFYTFPIQFSMVWGLYFGEPSYIEFQVPFYRRGRTSLITGLLNAIYAALTAIDYFIQHYSHRRICV